MPSQSPHGQISMDQWTTLTLKIFWHFKSWTALPFSVSDFCFPSGTLNLDKHVTLPWKTYKHLPFLFPTPTGSHSIGGRPLPDRKKISDLSKASSRRSFCPRRLLEISVQFTCFINKPSHCSCSSAHPMQEGKWSLPIHFAPMAIAGEPVDDELGQCCSCRQYNWPLPLH